MDPQRPQNLTGLQSGDCVEERGASSGWLRDGTLDAAWALMVSILRGVWAVRLFSPGSLNSAELCVTLVSES